MPSISTVSAVPASEAGALSGFEASCSCGLTLRSSLRTALDADIAAHVAWHTRRDDRDPAACAECGHLHFLGPDAGYCECPIDGCGCEGQAWARELAGARSS